MENGKNKLAAAIAVLFEIILIITMVVNGANGSKKNMFLSFLTAICILLPFVFSRVAEIKSITLPKSFILVTLSFILSAQCFGELLRFYYRFWWWDLMLHGIFGFYTVLIGIYIINGVVVKDQSITKKRFIVLIVVFGFCFSMTLGMLWELFEFAGDYLVKSNMMKEGLIDTMTDLLASTSTAIIYVVVYYFRST